MFKGAFRRNIKVKPANMETFFYTQHELMGDSPTLAQHAEDKAEEGIAKMKEELGKIVDERKRKEDAIKHEAAELQRKIDEEKRLTTPQEITMETAPSDVFLEPPKKKAKVEEEPKYVQKNPPITERKVYYTQVIN